MTNTEPTSLQPELELAEALPGARFTELHTRIVDAPIDEVWPHTLAVAAREVRALGPLMAMRRLPQLLPRLLRRDNSESPRESRALLDGFVDEGFVLLRRDEVAEDGRAVVLFGAAGRFWSPTSNQPIPFTDPQSLLDFDEPGYAKTVARLEAVDLGGSTRLETETWVMGTDKRSTAKFGAYWALIRYPSGLIRRSWLAAIDRRVKSSTISASNP